MKALSLAIVLLSVKVSGESVTINPGPSNIDKNSVEVISKDFFNEKAPGKGEGAKPSAEPRYNAGDPDYNTEQREQWLRACEKYKNKDLETYRKCFQDEKAKSKETLRQSFEEVERRQALPLKNVNPLLDEQQRNVNGDDED